MYVFLYIKTGYKLYKTYTTSWLKLPLYDFCIYAQCTNYTKCMQMLITSYMATDVCFLYIQKLYILYFLNFRISNDAFFHSIFASLQNFRTSFFIFKKIQQWICIKKVFIINLIYFNFINYILTFFTGFFFFLNVLFGILFIQIKVTFINL